jgi:hypothetical protein
MTIIAEEAQHPALVAQTSLQDALIFNLRVARRATSRHTATQKGKRQ